MERTNGSELSFPIYWRLVSNVVLTVHSLLKSNFNFARKLNDSKIPADLLYIVSSSISSGNNLALYGLLCPLNR